MGGRAWYLPRSSESEERGRDLLFFLPLTLERAFIFGIDFGRCCMHRKYMYMHDIVFYINFVITLLPSVHYYGV